MSEELQLAPIERTEIERYADVAPVISIEQAIARHRLLSEYVKQVMREHHARCRKTDDIVWLDQAAFYRRENRRLDRAN
jgi:hypothetical protein